MKKLLFVFNPFSGKAQIKNHLFEIVDTMVKAGYEVTVYPTQSVGDGKEKILKDYPNANISLICKVISSTITSPVTCYRIYMRSW